MTADLLTRARSAVTVEDECDVIDDAMPTLWTGTPFKLDDLHTVIDTVRIGYLPRAVLLGVVAALVPRRDDIATINLRIWPNAIGPGNGETEAELCGWVDTGPSVDEPVIGDGSAATPALALLIAIMEAGNVEA